MEGAADTRRKSLMQGAADTRKQSIMQGAADTRRQSLMPGAADTRRQSIMPGATDRRRQSIRPNEPITPANNKYLAKRWDQEIFNEHLRKVDNAKAIVDNKSPIVNMHLHVKLKKLQAEAERLATIQRDNRILMERMAHIMRTGGLVDHIKYDHELKSLNQNKRRRELLRITYENQAILKRLASKNPHYNHKQWLHQWRMNQHYLINVSSYAHPWRPEQSVYRTMGRRQSIANKKINDKVRSNSIALVAHQSTNEPKTVREPSTPYTESREQGTDAFKFSKVKFALDLVSSSTNGMVDGDAIVKQEVAEEMNVNSSSISNSNYEQAVNRYMTIVDGEVIAKPDEEKVVVPVSKSINKSVNINGRLINQ